MKKVLFYIMTVALLLLFVSCNNSYTVIEEPPEIENNEIEAEILGVQYIRTDGYNETFVYPRLIKITSVESLDYYYSAFNGIYSLGKREKIYADTTIGFADAAENYDAEFFENYDLYLAVIEEGSGSIRHLVEGVEDGFVEITSLIPEVGTDDMAEWHIVIEVNKGGEIKGINKKETPIYTPYEIYSEFLNLLETIAGNYLKDELGITDYELLEAVKTDFGKVSEGGFIDPLGYSPGYSESPVWNFSYRVNEAAFGELVPRTVELYLCDAPFVFGYKNIPS